MLSYSEKMLAAIESEDFAEAQINLEKALHEDSTDMLMSLAEELNLLGYLEEAKQVYESLYQRFPDVDELKIPLAEIAIEENELDQAFEYLETIEKESEFYPHRLLVQADIYQLLELPEVAEQKLKELRQLMPDEGVVKFAQAEFYYSVNQLEKALVLYESLMEAGETKVNGILLEERIGVCLALMGEFEEAIPYLEHALEDDATDERLYQLGMTYAQIQENQKAIALFRQIKELSPHFSQVYYPLAELLKQENLPEEALKVAAEGIQENPYSVLLYHLASDFSYTLHQPDDTEEYLRKALQLEEDRELSLLKLSSFLLLEERYEDALDALDQLEDTEYPLALWNLAQAYNGLEDYEKAAVYYEKAAPHLLQEPDFLKEYGLFLREEGRKEEAQKIFQHYLQLVPGDLEIVTLLEE